MPISFKRIELGGAPIIGVKSGYNAKYVDKSLDAMKMWEFEKVRFQMAMGRNYSIW